MANEAKMRIALDKKFKSPEHKKAFMDMSDSAFKEAYEISKRAEDLRFQENSRVSTLKFSQEVWQHHYINHTVNMELCLMLKE